MIEDTLSYRLLKAMKRTRSVIDPVLTEHGLYPGQDLLLSRLWRDDGISQSELIARLGVEAPTITKALQRLERAGFIRREPAGARRRQVYLTEAGRALQEPVERAWREADEMLASELSTDEKEQLTAILGRLTGR